MTGRDERLTFEPTTPQRTPAHQRERQRRCEPRKLPWPQQVEAEESERHAHGSLLAHVAALAQAARYAHRPASRNSKYRSNVSV